MRRLPSAFSCPLSQYTEPVQRGRVLPFKNANLTQRDSGVSLEKAFRLLGCLCLKKIQRSLVRRAVARAALLVLKNRELVGSGHTEGWGGGETWRHPGGPGGPLGKWGPPTCQLWLRVGPVGSQPLSSPPAPPTWPQSPVPPFPLPGTAPPRPSHGPRGFEPFCLLREFTNPKWTCDWSSQGCPQGAGSDRHTGWSLQDLTPPPQPYLLLPPVWTAQAAFHPRMYFELPQEGSLGPT